MTTIISSHYNAHHNLVDSSFVKLIKKNYISNNINMSILLKQNSLLNNIQSAMNNITPLQTDLKINDNNSLYKMNSFDFTTATLEQIKTYRQIQQQIRDTAYQLEQDSKNKSRDLFAMLDKRLNTEGTFEETVQKYAETMKEDIYKTMSRKQQSDNCKDCNSNSFIELANGFSTCTKCGLCKEEVKLTQNEEVLDGRSSVNDLLPISSMSTILSGNNHLTKIHSWNKVDTREKYLIEVYNKIEEAGSDLYCLKIVQKAKYYFKTVFYDNKVWKRGTTKSTMIALCLYYSCINCGEIPKVQLLLNKFNISRVKFEKGIKTFSKIEDKQGIIVNKQKVVQMNKGVNDLAKLFEQLGIEDKYIEAGKTIFTRMRVLGHIIKYYNLKVIYAGIFRYLNLKYNLKVPRSVILDHFGITTTSLNKVKRSIANNIKVYTIGFETIDL